MMGGEGEREHRGLEIEENGCEENGNCDHKHSQFPVVFSSTRCFSYRHTIRFVSNQLLSMSTFATDRLIVID